MNDVYIKGCHKAPTHLGTSQLHTGMPRHITCLLASAGECHMSLAVEGCRRHTGGTLMVTAAGILRLGSTGMILGLCPANERRRYFVTISLIGWAQTWNQPCLPCMFRHWCINCYCSGTNTTHKYIKIQYMILSNWCHDTDLGPSQYKDTVIPV